MLSYLEAIALRVGCGSRWCTRRPLSQPARWYEIGEGSNGDGMTALEVWEVKEVVGVEKIAVLQPELDDGGEDEEEYEEEEVKHHDVEKLTLLGVVQLNVLLGTKSPRHS